MPQGAGSPASQGSFVDTEAFGPFDGRIWMNAAHQGPLPLVAVSAA